MRWRALAGAIALIAAPAIAAPAVAAPPAVRMAPLSAQLFLEFEGRFSRNLLDAKGQFTGWNTGAGEGPVEGQGSDVMIVASFSAPGNDEEAVFLDKPVVMRAVAGKKLLASRTIPSLMIPVKGRGHGALYLINVPCAGRIDVTAQWGRVVRTARLNMDCGE